MIILSINIYTLGKASSPQESLSSDGNNTADTRSPILVPMNTGGIVSNTHSHHIQGSHATGKIDEMTSSPVIGEKRTYSSIISSGIGKCIHKAFFYF